MRWRTIARTALCALVLAAVGGSSATAANDRPAPPTDVRVPALAFDEHSITLAWEKPADHAGIVDYHVFVNGQLAGSANSTGLSFGVARYEVFANGVPAGTIPVVGSTNTTTVSRLTPGTAYVLTLAAVDATGNVGTYTMSVSATTLPAYDRSVPRFPEDATVRASDVGARSVTLRWTPATDDQRVTGYRVYVNGRPVVGAVPFTPINSASTTADTMFTVTGLQPDTEYRFTVQAGDAANRWTGSGPRTTVRTDDWPDASEGQPEP